MIGLRLDGEEVWLEQDEWERWVVDGRVPPDAPVRLENTQWTRAGMLEAYRALLTGPEPPPRGPSLLEVLFPARGLSATEALLLINILITGVLVFLNRSTYSFDLRRWTEGWWFDVHDRGAVWLWIPTLFLHADGGHLGRNMVSLLAGAGAVEFLLGARWTVAAYLITGIAGMALSYWGHGGPPLSVGASGAIFGLLGITVGFLLRRRRLFTYRQRWKTRRVYLPLFIALFLPSLLHADYYAHTGGLVAGFFLGAFAPAHRRVRELMEPMGVEGDGTATGG